MRALIAVIVAVECLAAANTSAQSQVTLVPAAAVATIYDDNLFSAPKGVADVVTSVRPSLEGRYESPTANISSFAYFDMQRSLNNPTLTTLDARRDASKPAVIITVKDGKFHYLETIAP